MRYNYAEYGYPNTPEEGLEKDKSQYKYQLIKNEDGILTEDEYNNFMVELACNQNVTIEDIEGGIRVCDGDKVWKFFE